MESLKVIDRERLYTAKEVANLLGVSRETVYVWSRMGLGLKAPRGCVRNRRVIGSELYSFIKGMYES